MMDEEDPAELELLQVHPVLRPGLLPLQDR